MIEIERAKKYPALKAERITRNDIIQGNINMLDSGARECRRIGELASAEEKEIISEILRAELNREKNPLTCDGCLYSYSYGTSKHCDGCIRNQSKLVDNYYDNGKAIEEARNA